MFTEVNGTIPLSGAWLDTLSGTDMGIGLILPLLSVKRIAMALPSGCVTITVTFSSGMRALPV
jgi:hypothetical protein